MKSEKPSSSLDLDTASRPQTETEYLAQQSKLARTAITRPRSDPMSWMSWVREHPCATAGAAFAAGFIVCKLLTSKPATPTPAQVEKADNAKPEKPNWLFSMLSGLLVQALEGWLARQTAPSPVDQPAVKTDAT